ncbi:MAG: hypothetical protein O3B21_10130 [Proteobacteria bacterium]|nr:hypothetical protein [Pseudomonadota bacterium]MDA1356077.1 hypothetical protein [Pseudomonadota bacterium]
MRRAKTFGIMLVAFCFAAGGQVIWKDQAQAASGQGDALVKEISGLIDEADSARAADPKFLDDLRQALEDYQGPKLVSLMHDDFGDGNFSRNPLWQEAEGKFTIDGKRGLKSLANKPPPSQADMLSKILKELEAKKADKGRYTLVQSATLANKPYVPVGEEIERVQAAIKAADGPSPMQGRLAALEEIRDDSGRFTLVQSMILSGKPNIPVGEEIERTQEVIAKEQAAKAAAQQSGRAELYTRLDISNSFSIQLDLLSSKADGRFEMDVFQGFGRTAGYRLAYNAGASPSFELLRFGSSGSRRLASHNQAIKLEDGYRHLILFSRDESGGMSVSMDGKTLVQASDKSFRDPFNGVALINNGGEFAVREISVMGVQ